MPPSKAGGAARTPLTHQRLLEAAVALADRIGIGALTIRKLAVELDVKPMTIYHHIPNKEAIIDGMVELVFAEIEAPARRALEGCDCAPSEVGPCRACPSPLGHPAAGLPHQPGARDTGAP